MDPLFTDTYIHRGVQQKQVVLVCHTIAAPLPREAARRYSLAFLRRKATEQDTGAWREDTEKRTAGRRVFRLSTTGSRPAIGPALRRTPKRVATVFFQLLSGHSMIAPFLKERWVWTDADVCWWCGKGRQSREHLFKKGGGQQGSAQEQKGFWLQGQAGEGKTK